MPPSMLESASRHYNVCRDLNIVEIHVYTAIPRHPICCSGAPKLKPGVSFSINTAPMPFAPGASDKRQYTTYASAWPPPEHQRLAPFTTTVSPSISPVVFRSVKAVPACGSDIDIAITISPAQTAGNIFACNASGAKWAMVLPASLKTGRQRQLKFSALPAPPQNAQARHRHRRLVN